MGNRLKRIKNSQLNNSFLNRKVLEKLSTKEERGMKKGNNRKSRHLKSQKENKMPQNKVWMKASLIRRTRSLSILNKRRSLCGRRYLSHLLKLPQLLKKFNRIKRRRNELQSLLNQMTKNTFHIHIMKDNPEDKCARKRKQL